MDRGRVLSSTRTASFPPAIWWTADRASRPSISTPLVDPTNPFATNTNVTFLADSQNNNAWAVFGDATYEFNPQWEFDAAIRYDQD